MSSKDFTFIDLFAGIGGMRLGFESAGGKCLLTSDIDTLALETYKENFHPRHAHTYAGDIFKLASKDVPKHDVLLAGFPCQPYSLAGLRKGLDDPRGTVFLEIIRILEDKKPQAFLLENVKGLIGHDQGRTFDYIVSMLTGAGYHVDYKVLNTMTHGGVPQNRERVFIVGFRDKKALEKFVYPEPITLTKSIADMLEKGTVAPKYYYDSRFKSFAEIKKGVTEEGVVYQWRRKYVRANKSGVCPTITANAGSGGHNLPLIKIKDGIRKLTPRECANLQAFPKSFKLPSYMSDSTLYHQFGNSVTVSVISRIAKNMAKVLSE